MAAQAHSLPKSESLTGRERQVLALIAGGQSTKQVAATLGVSFKTAACHRYRITSKLGAHNTAEMIRAAARRGLIDFGLPAPAFSEPEGSLSERISDALEEHRRARESLRRVLDDSMSLRRSLSETRSELKDACKKYRQTCEQLIASIRHG